MCWGYGNLVAGGTQRTGATQSRMLRQLGERSLDHVFRRIERAVNPIAPFRRRGVVGRGDRDGRFHRHAGTGESGVGVAGVEPDADSEAADDLCEVAGRIVGWDQRKFRPRCREDRFDITANWLRRISIDVDADRIADLHSADLGLAVIGFHPEIVNRNDREHARAGGDVFADPCLAVGHNAEAKPRTSSVVVVWR